MAFAAVIQGAAMLIVPGDWPAERFPAAHSVFDAFPGQPIAWWGACYLLAGLAKTIILRPWCAAVLATVLAAWVACALLGIIDAYLAHEQPPTSPTGWLWAAVAVVVLVLPGAAKRVKL